MYSAGEIPSDRSIDVATLYAIGECTLEGVTCTLRHEQK